MNTDEDYSSDLKCLYCHRLIKDIPDLDEASDSTLYNPRYSLFVCNDDLRLADEDSFDEACKLYRLNFNYKWGGGTS